MVLDKTPLYNALDSQAVTPAQKSYNKLQFKTTEVFRIVSVQRKTTAAEEEVVGSTVSIEKSIHTSSKLNRTQFAKKSLQKKADASKNRTPSAAHDNRIAAD